MSGAHSPAVGVAQDGRVAGVKTSPTYVQSNRSRERRIGISRGSVCPANSGSLVPYAYQKPSRPRITAGSANVSAAPADTGLCDPGWCGVAVAGTGVARSAAATRAARRGARLISKGLQR